MSNEEIKDQQEETEALQDNPQTQEAATNDNEAQAVSDDNPLASLEKQRDELKDKYLRLFAEFDNYKKRTIKERIDYMKTAAQDTIVALLPVLDDFERAKKNADDENSTEVFSEGVNLVYQKLFSILQQKGLEPMESNGEAFDPEFHEALTEVPAPSEEMKGKIIDTVERGYKLKDKIIRHAKVVVGK